MKKILIITLYGNNNFGNKLQNYALQEYLKNLNDSFVIFTQKIKYDFTSDNIFVLLRNYLKYIYRYFISLFNFREKRFKYFSDKYLNYTEDYYYINDNNMIKDYDFYIYGSDQIWNPNGVGKYGLFLGECSSNNISYAASFSSNEIPVYLNEKYKNSLNLFKCLSVREEKGKELVEQLTNRDDICVLIDPTMLLTCNEWNKIILKPKTPICKKYILNYFLGDLSSVRRKEIDRIANENDCEIINILDKKGPFYNCGPSEFLYLEKHAFLVCTDSFHSCVFAFLYNVPFIVFDREDHNVASMYSRIDTLISKFKLKNRKFDGKITNNNLKHDYTEGYKILEEERKKSEAFLKKALDIKE